MQLPIEAEAFLDRLRGLGQWESDGKRAPHKPLLLLLIFGRVQRGEQQDVSFGEIEAPLRELLRDFGPPWPTTPLYPFWYLQTDGLWEVPDGEGLERRSGKLEPKITALRAHGLGRLPDAIDKMLRSDHELLRTAAQLVLDRHFEPSLHPGICAACRLELRPAVTTPEKKKRDRAFRAKVLMAYEYRCAACGWNVFLGREALGLEAAHVFWHTLGGPDEVANGLCLCSLHHLALDRGAISIDQEGRLLVSQHVNGSTGVATGLHALAGQAVRLPQPGNPAPDAEHISWHRDQVFRAPARAH